MQSGTAGNARRGRENEEAFVTDTSDPDDTPEDVEEEEEPEFCQSINQSVRERFILREVQGDVHNLVLLGSCPLKPNSSLN